MSASSISYPRAYGLYEPGVTLSADGRYLAYSSYTAGSRHASVLMIDTVGGGTRVLQAGSDNYAPALASGAIAYTTVSDNGAPSRIALADFATGATSFASTAANGEAANGASDFASMSANGRYVAFESDASNLVAGDTNSARDVFVKDMLSGAVQRVSVSASGAQLAGDSGAAVLSADGKVVLFHSVVDAANGDTSQGLHLYARNLDSGKLTEVAADSAGHAGLSGDGRYVAFAAAGEVFRKDLASGALEQVSHGEGELWNADPSISADGRYISFGLASHDASVPGSPVLNEIVVRDMLTGALSQISHGSDAGQSSFHPVLSSDASQLAFVRYAGTDGDNFDVSWDVVVAKLVFDAAVSARGTAGNDVFASTAGNDSFNGGDGTDKVSFRGRMADYDIGTAGGTVKVSDHAAARDGADTLVGIERLQFADGVLAFDTGVGAIGGEAYRIYQAAFNRAPDLEGLGFWVGTMDRGQSLASVAACFMQSAEFIKMYGAAPDNATVVDKLYQNVLHRPGEAAGVAYWNGVLDEHRATPAEVLAYFSESTENVANLVGVLANGFVYTPYG